MDFIRHLFTEQPLVALFITIALGYFVGKLKVGSFVLGGIAGTLLVGVVIGQFGVNIDPGIKTIFFALFIYAVGFQGGPQFFHALNLRSLNQLVSAFVMCFTGLLCVLAAAWMFGLDRGMAAGLAAGGLTQSAILGTAGDAIAKLGLVRRTDENHADQRRRRLCGLLHLRLARPHHHGHLVSAVGDAMGHPQGSGGAREKPVRRRAELEPGQFDAVNDIITRVYQVTRDHKAIGQTTLELDRQFSDAAVEGIYRGGKSIDFDDTTVIQLGDAVAMTGKLTAVQASNAVARR